MVTNPPDPMGWISHAACRGADVAIFFPSSNSNEARKAAMALCASCPVRKQCLELAIETDSTFGIFGGTTQTQRRSIARKANPRAPRYSDYPGQHGTEAGYRWEKRRGMDACPRCESAGLEARRERRYALKARRRGEVVAA